VGLLDRIAASKTGLRLHTPLVHALIVIVRPAAVLRRIRPVVVDALKCQAYGLFSHVGKEVLEGRQPPVAHSYSSASPVGVTRMVRVSTPANRVLPAPVGAGSGVTGLVPVLSGLFGNPLALQATTALVCTLQEHAGRGGTDFSAVAPASPVDMPRPVRFSFQDYETRKALSGEVRMSFISSSHLRTIGEVRSLVKAGA
jgi:hypothetical protein